MYQKISDNEFSKPSEIIFDIRELRDRKAGIKANIAQSQAELAEVQALIDEAKLIGIKE